MVGFISNLAPLLNYLRTRSPGPPFPPDSRQAGERGAKKKTAEHNTQYEYEGHIGESVRQGCHFEGLRVEGGELRVVS